VETLRDILIEGGAHYREVRVSSRCGVLPTMGADLAVLPMLEVHLFFMGGSERACLVRGKRASIVLVMFVGLDYCSFGCGLEKVGFRCHCAR